MSNWPYIILEQHDYLKKNVLNIMEMLKCSHVDILNVDPKMKLLIKCVFIHLSMEENFIYPRIKNEGEVKKLTNRHEELRELFINSKNLLTEIKITSSGKKLDDDVKSKIILILESTLMLISNEDKLYSRAFDDYV